jgi:16S rRNA (cytidine1402-2'-O)-methyltransferase
MLYIVSTPIWNLEDITLRALRILWEVDCIACEDTRTSGVLLKHYDIKKPLLSYHSHSWQAKTDKILTLLSEWKDVALISDAWTPGISDPWYALIRDCLEAWHELSPIPWVSAAITALSASWMPMNHFLYLGFLPVKKWRQTLLKRLSSNKNETYVIYESVHRLEKTLVDFEKYFWKDHKIVIGRELTKKFEEFVRGNIEMARNYFKEHPEKIKWEFVILI